MALLSILGQLAHHPLISPIGSEECFLHLSALLSSLLPSLLNYQTIQFKFSIFLFQFLQSCMSASHSATVKLVNMRSYYPSSGVNSVLIDHSYSNFSSPSVNMCSLCKHVLPPHFYFLPTPSCSSSPALHFSCPTFMLLLLYSCYCSHAPAPSHYIAATYRRLVLAVVSFYPLVKLLAWVGWP